jgi:hypothetical protein
MKINEKISKEGNVEGIVCEVNIFIEDASDCAVDMMNTIKSADDTKSQQSRVIKGEKRRDQLQ